LLPYHSMPCWPNNHHIQSVPRAVCAMPQETRSKKTHFNHPRFLKYHIGTSALAIMIVSANG
jgi:hypothetical protein